MASNDDDGVPRGLEDPCEVCGGPIRDFFKFHCTREQLHAARKAMGFGSWDLCWLCWNGIADQYVAAPETFPVAVQMLERRPDPAVVEDGFGNEDEAVT